MPLEFINKAATEELGQLVEDVKKNVHDKLHLALDLASEKKPLGNNFFAVLDQLNKVSEKLINRMRIE